MYHKYIPPKNLFYQTILCVFALSYSLTAVSQTSKYINGKVTNEKGDLLTGVTVVVEGTTIGTTTDVKGNYSIDVPKMSDTLVFSYIGFEHRKVPVGDKKTINIILKPNASELNSVVVIGYGTQSRADVTTSISKLDNTVLKHTPFANVTHALEGTIPGARVQSTSGQPGAAAQIIIRGGTSINNPNGSAPLYVVDGVVRTNLNGINAGDIASIQVLKDAASTAIYGARGSNGVVLITLKNGQAGQTRITFNSSITFSQVGKEYKMADAHDYIYYSRLGQLAAARKIPGALTALTNPSGWGTGNDLTKNTAYTTQYLTPANKYLLNQGWQSMPDPIDPSKTIIYKNTNWQDVLFHTAVSSNHYLSVEGGTQRATFHASVGYMSDEGTAITTKYNQLSFDVGGKIQVLNNLSISSEAMYSTSSNNQVYNTTDLFFRAVGLPPTTKYTFQDGSLAPGLNQSLPNPAYFLNKDVSQNSDDHLTLSIGGRWDILPGLSFEPQLILYKVASDGYSFMPSFLNGVGSLNTTRSASSSYAKQMQYQTNVILDYKKTFNTNHNFDWMIGTSYIGIQDFSLSAAGNGAATDLIPTLNASSTPISVSGSQSGQKLIGYFSRVNYNYKQKYLISASGRFDGASNLGANHKWGFFPGLSVGWRVDKENFWYPLTNLFQLKLRASYGVNGNISGLGDFQSEGAYSVGSFYAGSSAIVNSIIANPNLEWERSKTLDVGADLGFLNARGNLIFDFYHKRTDNLLTTLSLPPSTGFSGVFTNLGSLGNKGIEIGIDFQILPPSSKFQWKISFNAAKNKDKILRLPNNGVPNNRIGGFYVYDLKTKKYDWEGGLQEGGTLGNMFAWKQIGIYPTDKAASTAPKDMTMPFVDKTKYGGDVEYADKDGNDTIDTRDLYYMGQPYPIWTGGMTNVFSYKNFTFLLRFDYMTGFTIYNQAKIFLSGGWSTVNFPEDMVTKGWHKQGDKAEYPQYVDGTANYSYWRGSQNYTNQTTNSMFYESGNFLCIREVTLNYAVPLHSLQKSKIKDLEFNITGSNLYYFTKYDGMNPELGGVDAGRYPMPRNLTIGATISF